MQSPLRGCGIFICPLLKASFQRYQIKMPPATPRAFVARRGLPAAIHRRFALPNAPRRLRRLGFLFSSALANKFASLLKTKHPHYVRALLLPDEDSNLDKQNQNLSYYHYTIGQNLLTIFISGPPSSGFHRKGVQK